MADAAKVVSREVEAAAQAAVSDAAVLRALLDGVGPATQRSAVRETSSQALMLLASRSAEVLLPHWDYLAGLLNCGNGFSQYVAIYVLTDLCRVDREGRFARVFDAYFQQLDDRSLMVASHTALRAGLAAAALPELQHRIIERLEAIDRTHFDQDRKEIIKGYAIAAFDQFVEHSPERERIVAWVARQSASTCGKTRKDAIAFGKKWGRGSSGGPAAASGRAAGRGKAKEKAQ